VTKKKTSCGAYQNGGAAKTAYNRVRKNGTISRQRAGENEKKRRAPISSVPRWRATRCLIGIRCVKLSRYVKKPANDNTVLRFDAAGTYRVA